MATPDPMVPTADGLNRKGIEYYTRGDNTAAKFYYQAALYVDPEFVPALANLAMVLNHENKLAAALPLQYRVCAKVPHDAAQLSNLGNTLTRLFRHDEARRVLELSSQLGPDNAGVWHNLALLEGAAGNYQQAIVYIDQAERLGASPRSIQNDRAHFLLGLGDFKDGLVEYEARWYTMKHSPAWDFHIPEWQGEDLTGKHILFHAEQGFGDSIMTSRFARNLQDRGARVTMALPTALCSLFTDQPIFSEIDILDLGSLDYNSSQTFDYHSPMYSAMRWLGIRTQDISGKPYLTAPETDFGGSLMGFGFRKAEPDCLHVGVCWASGARPGEMGWRRRVSQLEDWLVLADIPGVRLHAVMQDCTDEITNLGAEALVADHSVNLTNWRSTAELISRLDLLVSVDTAVVHLAGALGVPCRMLAQFVPCWRWWNLKSGSGRPWYNQMYIYPQREPGNWKSQLRAVRHDLSVWSFMHTNQKGLFEGSSEHAAAAE